MKKLIYILVITVIISGCQSENNVVGDPAQLGLIFIVNESNSEVIIVEYYPNASRRNLQSNETDDTFFFSGIGEGSMDILSVSGIQFSLLCSATEIQIDFIDGNDSRWVCINPSTNITECTFTVTQVMVDTCS